MLIYCGITEESIKFPCMVRQDAPRNIKQRVVEASGGVFVYEKQSNKHFFKLKSKKKLLAKIVPAKIKIYSFVLLVTFTNVTHLCNTSV